LLDNVSVTADIRQPEHRDADAMGRVHVRAWQAAYRSVMPDDYLDGLDPEERASMWRRQIAARGGAGVLVVSADDEVAGFAAFGPCHDDGAPAEQGQVYAINLDPAHWRKGLGRDLLRAGTAELAALGFKSLVLWVVLQNERARRFYESEGWVADGMSREEEVLGAVATEVRYVRRLEEE
jgi:RimJ/RimL family protein N-acetyltransferase